MHGTSIKSFRYIIWDMLWLLFLSSKRIRCDWLKNWLMKYPKKIHIHYTFESIFPSIFRFESLPCAKLFQHQKTRFMNYSTSLSNFSWFSSYSGHSLWIFFCIIFPITWGSFYQFAWMNDRNSSQLLTILKNGILLHKSR